MDSPAVVVAAVEPGVASVAADAVDGECCVAVAIDDDDAGSEEHPVAAAAEQSYHQDDDANQQLVAVAAAASLWSDLAVGSCYWLIALKLHFPSGFPIAAAVELVGASFAAAGTVAAAFAVFAAAGSSSAGLTTAVECW